MPASTPLGDAALLGALPGDLQRLLVLLALTEPLNISGYSELAAAVGLRQSVRVAHSTSSLRQALQPLFERGLVTGGDPFFRCAPNVRSVALRHAVASGWLVQLLPGARAWGARRWGSYRSELQLLEARVALFQRASGAEGLLVQAAQIEPSGTIALCRDALCAPFDAAELAALGPALRTTALALLLPAAEAYGFPLPGLYEHLARDPSRVGADEPLLQAFAGVAINRGDGATLERLAPLPDAVSLRPALSAAAAVLAGDFTAAQTALAPQGKRSPIYAGLLGVLQVLVLLREPDAPAVELARRVTHAASRESRHLAATYRVLRQLVVAEGGLKPTGDAGRQASSSRLITDAWLPLVTALDLLWRRTPSSSAPHAVVELEHVMRLFALQDGAPWLYAQYFRAHAELSQRLPARTVRFFDPPAPTHEARFLGELRIQRAPWEQSLERLARLTAPATPAHAAPADGVDDAERVLWRVSPSLAYVEPYLQKRSRGTWTRGRRLALQHLLAGRPLVARLPPEDQRAATFARERRSMSGGYPGVDHFLAPGVFAALVGHPRVTLGDGDEPVEVVAGTVQVIARRESGGLRLALDPPELRDAVTVRREGDRLVVYTLEGKALAIAEALGAGLTVPAAGKARALAVLEQVAHLLPVQSAEQTAARSVEADAVPWFRLVPRERGLAVSLGVRPLGEGPRFFPGEGAPTVLGRSGGEAVQTERDLALERRHARRAVEACPALAGNETGSHEWRLGEVEDCLALVAELQALGDAVHVEWPEGAPLRVRGRLRRGALRGRMQRRGGEFLLQAALALDDELTLDLEALLGLVAERPERFVRLESGEYVELEEELRDTLEAMAAARVDPRGRSGKGGKGGKGGGVALAPSALPVLERLTAADSGFSLDRDSAAWRERVDQAFARRIPVPRALQAELRPYQLEGFRWLARLAELELGACLADDMGVGKTVQLIALLLHRAKSGPALVVAPTSVCDNWRRELSRFAPSLEVLTYWGPDRGPQLGALGPRRVLLTSYAILQQDAAALQEIPWATAVLDEAQLIKNAETQRAQAAFGLRASARVVATGTPVENHLGDLHALFRFLMPELLGSWQTFSRRFGAATTDAAGASGHRALKRLLRPFVLRRTRAEVLDDLPPLTEIEHGVTLSPGEARLYEAVRRAAVQKLAEVGQDPRSRVQVLAEITRLRRLCCHPRLVAPDAELGSSKLEAFLELMEELRDGHHRALVFSQFVDVLALARELLDARGIAYQYLDGSTSQRQRAVAVEAFQAGEGDAFLISLKAGGFGLNLTGADYVILLDPWWNPAVEAQASGRAHRIGQSRPVTVYRLVTAGTVEAKIVELHRQKRELAESLLDGTDRAASLGIDELRDLLAR